MASSWRFVWQRPNRPSCWDLWNDLVAVAQVLQKVLLQALHGITLRPILTAKNEQIHGVCDASHDMAHEDLLILLILLQFWSYLIMEHLNAFHQRNLQSLSGLDSALHFGIFLAFWSSKYRSDGPQYVVHIPSYLLMILPKNMGMV